MFNRVLTGNITFSTVYICITDNSALGTVHLVPTTLYLKTSNQVQRSIKSSFSPAHCTNCRCKYDEISCTGIFSILWLIACCKAGLWFTAECEHVIGKLRDGMCCTVQGFVSDRWYNIVKGMYETCRRKILGRFRRRQGLTNFNT